MKRLFRSIITIILIGSMCACSITQNSLQSENNSPSENNSSNGSSTTNENNVSSTADNSSLLKQCTVAEATYPDVSAIENTTDYRLSNLLSEESSKKFADFGFSVASQILKTTDGNTIISPLSLYYALSIAADGARGDTQTEILDVLGFDFAEELRKEAGKLYRFAYTDDEFSQLKIANSLWIDSETNLNKDSGFISDISESFYGSLYSVDFQDSATSGLISKWISDNTNGQLSPSIITNPEQIMSIINTIHLKTEWADRFDAEKNTEELFHGTEGDKTTTFMNIEYDSYGFTRGDGWISSSLSTKSGASVVFVLPDEGIDVRSLIDTPEKLEAMFGSSCEWLCGEVTFKIPKLESQSDISLNETLKALGINSAFSDTTADFSGITPDKAFISNIRQQTKITMNEEGIEASSFTKLDYCGAALPTDKADIILDRPFIYGITYNNDKLLFIGIYENAE